MADTVLIVDDEPAIREAMRRALRHAPYRLLDAGSGDEALAILAQEPVDLLVSDHNMPGMTGLALCEEAERRHPTVVRIIMTGAADAQLAADAMERETVLHFLQKPWDGRELVLLLKLALRHRADLCEIARLRQLVRTQRRIIADLESQRPGDAARGAAPTSA